LKSHSISSAVDAKHNLVVATHTINKNDRSALSAIAIEAKENLGIETYTALVDKGYHNGKQIEICKQANITTIVAQPEQGKSNENGTTKDYLVAQFQYNQDTDTYTCPQGETLKLQAVGIRKPPIETAIILKNTEPQNAKHVL
jgi:hypothetical protein